MTLSPDQAAPLRENLKLLFDENISPKAVRAMQSLVAACGDRTSIISIVDHKRQYGHDDRQWIPAVQPEGWIVITGDRGRSNKGARLPRVCREQGVRHVLLAKAIHQAPQFRKVRAILAVWDEICALPEAPAGTRSVLQLHGSSKQPKLRRDDG